ncbi:tRNA (N6-isopentenyl adenosine(37)-C2)-methylthiotransferase MiaB [Candidatus Mycalebacterium sp.]
MREKNPQKNPPLLYIETYGCQMNEYDSDRIVTALGAEKTPEPSLADYIVVNTCAIREKADHKAFSSVGKFKRLKAVKPEVVIGMAGCVAQLYGDAILKKNPHLDFVIGPRAIPKLPALIADIEQSREHERVRKSKTSFDIEETFAISPAHDKSRVSAFVSVQQGCNKRCAYCIVPTVRGDEVNRPLADILSEARMLVSKGVKEITFVGQTVNSWKGGGEKFSDLLRAVAEIEGLERIRFTTPYPRDITKKMIEAMRDTPKVCRHIHLPVQSGSDRVLKLMNRTYTSKWYLEAVDRLKDAIPGIAVSTDVIIGFPGESGDDFAQTMNLLEKVRFDSSFSFKFSPRPGTPAAEADEQISVKTADERLAVFQERQREITLESNRAREGKDEYVLVSGEGRHGNGWMTGRTTHNRIVNFIGDGSLTGSFVKVRVTDGLANSLRGEIVSGEIVA